MKTAVSVKEVALSQEQIAGEPFFKIANSDEMRSFFMSIVSDSNHWMFIASNGGLSAGRKNSENALFPYYTDDKITEAAETTGSKTILRVKRAGEVSTWEPFSERYVGKYNSSRNIYKHIFGNKIIFEEVNHDLGLTFRYQWASSDIYGFVRQSTLVNHSGEALDISLLDGLQNILPYGVPSELQMRSSNLVDAYKRSELDATTGVGIYALSATIVDRAEPSEALKANIAWSTGLEQATRLLSPLQIDAFRHGRAVQEETDVKGEKGAYLLSTDLSLAAGAEKQWMIIADINKNHAALIELLEHIRQEEALEEKIQADIALGTSRLVALNAASDGLQLTADNYRDARHFSNSLFNIMRGGIFDDNYQIEKKDFTDYLGKANQKAFEKTAAQLAELPEHFSLQQLKELADSSKDADFRRLALEYMPLTFSRRHGDPSRPWNKFSINTRSETDGSRILDYQGNWRDIFQNWEALAHSFPNFMESMVRKFLNASTFDGYNPYRVTKGGFDWETIEPDDPWAYIGYWGDHQIIYLLKFLEFMENKTPGKLATFFDDASFVYANVPYRIKSFAAIVQNSKDTIDFDHASDEQIRKKMAELGADGALLTNSKGAIHRVNFLEKILATLLSKLSNFIPEGGIWMNTQRPEWNDANNALVGNGVSMVTLYYLHRFLRFFKAVFAEAKQENVAISAELANFYQRIATALTTHKELLSGTISDADRYRLMAALGQAGSDYRTQVYDQAFSGEKTTIQLEELEQFVELGIRYLQHSIRANERQDALFHAYNLVTIEDEKAEIAYLSEMLEGQVAVLSSGYLSSSQALKVLDGLKQSKLFRPDQYSYILYPNKQLPGFLSKNTLPKEAVESTALLQTLLKKGDKSIVEQDVRGDYHFNGNFKNADDLKAALNAIPATYAAPSEADRKKVLAIFEQVFNHKAFTGRSGTFFGYEGLGSIYWHMVSKLLLAVQECSLKAIHEGADAETVGRLLEHYYEINEGIGVHKSPALYGAFPTDPYSHTPAHKGAQQPGMTGQVKEDVLSRFGELGVFVRNGQLEFDPCLLRKDEFLQEARTFNYLDVHGQPQALTLEKDSLCFTYCQVPVVYKRAAQKGIRVIGTKPEDSRQLDKLQLDAATSAVIFNRSGKVKRLEVTLDDGLMR